MHIAMIGTGYVGLVSGACLADFGHVVTCVDIDASKIASLKRGEIPIFEPGLEDVVASNARLGRLFFSTDLAAAVKQAEAVFIAVGTPSRHEDGQADMSFVHAAAREIAIAMDGFTVVVTKSTIPVGEGDQVEKIIRDTRPDAEFAVVSNPEFLREGAAVADFKHPDRVIIGADDPRAVEVMKELYRPLQSEQTPILFTSRRSSELTKYAANAFLATKITFINEIADLCDKAGADIQDVARGIGLDNRIGSKFLQAGPGIGGSCFPKDILALIKTARGFDSPVRIVETVEAVNDARKSRMSAKVINACGGSVAGKTIALLGLAFKPNTDDMRESPSIPIVAALEKAGARVKAHDPQSMGEARRIMPKVDLCEDPYECLNGAHAMVIVTEWEAFRALDLDRVKAALAAPVVVDLRNIYRPEELRRRGFTYSSIGRL
jgi:UDPglucose 6-dehydrogenase